MLRFLHIQKTGGSSLRRALRQSLGDRVIEDYHATSVHTVLRPFMSESPDPDRPNPRIVDPVGARAAMEAMGAKVLVGHGAYRRWATAFEPEETFVFLRDPRARVASAYHHQRRGGRFDRRLSLADFARAHPNMQARKLEGFALERAAFVGITERFAASVAGLNAACGFDLPVLEANVNPRKASVRERYDVDAETLAVIDEHNREDRALYDRALRIFDASS